MLKGFRDFVFRGNVIDLAVAVIIGAAFLAIVKSLVSDIINPLIAAVAGKPDFSYLTFTVHGGVIKYGLFLNEVISFLLVAAAVYFLVVVPANHIMSRVARAAAPTTKPCPQCLSDVPLAATRCAHCTQQIA